MDESPPGTPGPSLGPGKFGMLQSELLTDEVEDEYDALNDETFGGSLQAQDDWEYDHEKLIQLDQADQFDSESNGRTKTNSEMSMNGITQKTYENAFDDSLLHSSYGDSLFSNPEEALEESLKKLVLDDDLDDPAIMNISRSKPLAVPRAAISRRSPPPPAILESDNGSPSTSSIWTPPNKLESSPGGPSLPLRYSSLQKMLVKFQMLDDPSIVGIGKDIREELIPSDVIQKAKMVDEIERDLLNMNEKATLKALDIEHTTNKQSYCDMFSGDHQGSVCSSPPQRMESPFNLSQHIDSLSGRNAHFEVSSAGSSFNNSYSGDVGYCGSQSTYSIRPSSPYQMPKVNFKPYLGQPYMNRLIPPQVGITQPLIMQPRAFLGSSLRIPTVISSVNHPTVPGLVPFSQSQLRLAPRPIYFENRFQKTIPPHLYAQNLIRAKALKRPVSRLSNDPNYAAEDDEYANLMTQKEKEWLIKIQMIQLQTNNPYLDDYYYTMYTMKKKIEEQNKDGVDHAQEPKLVVPETSKTETKAYKPAQYEGSLGKLQAVSVNFPRKIIDLETMHPDDAENEASCNKELRKFRQVSLEIEKMYSLLLTVDDVDKKMAALPKESCHQLEDTKRNSIASIYNMLSTAIASEDKYVQIMNIRKGRNFVCRVLPLFALDEKFYLLTTIIDNWNVIMKKINSDEALLRFGLHFTDAICKSESLNKLIQIARALHKNATNTAFRMETLSNKNLNLQPALVHKLGIKITLALFTKAEELQQVKEHEDKDLELVNQWKNFVKFVAELWSSSSEVPLDDKSFAVAYKHFEYCLDDVKKAEFFKKLEAVRRNDRTADNLS